MKKHKGELCIFIIFFILISGVIFNNYLNNLDELWVFNGARNIANGLLPYKDFNLITTPGIPLLCRNDFKNFWNRVNCYESTYCYFRSYNIFIFI